MRIYYEHSFNQVLSVEREIGRHGVSTLADFGQQLLHILVVKGECTGQERVKDDSA